MSDYEIGSFIAQDFPAKGSLSASTHVYKVVEFGGGIMGQGPSYKTTLGPGLRAATKAEIAEWEAERERRAARRLAVQEENSRVLALAGLDESMFCRFRNAWEEDGVIYVETRENGVDGVSAEAIRQPTYRERETNGFDRTYVTYTFAKLAETKGVAE